MVFYLFTLEKPPSAKQKQHCESDRLTYYSLNTISDSYRNKSSDSKKIMSPNITAQRSNIGRKISSTKKLSIKFQLIALIFFISVFAIRFYASSQTGDVSNAESNFNIQLQTNSYSHKSVTSMLTQPDDKILVSGCFNTFNRQPVSGLIRLTADGLLDSTFNNNLMASGTCGSKIYLQEDGKILIDSVDLLVHGSNIPATRLLRLNSDGTLDPTFNFFNGNEGLISSMVVAEDGKITALGSFPQNINGASVYKNLIRMNPDGTLDNSFNFTAAAAADNIRGIAWQNNKLIVTYYDSSRRFVVSRLNADGSIDNTFASTALDPSVRFVKIAPDNKIVVMTRNSISCFNENGGIDESFQKINSSKTLLDFYFGTNGSITYSTHFSLTGDTIQFRRILANGTPDMAFSTISRYYPTGYSMFALQSDGEIFVGDTNSNGNEDLNNFVHLFSDGTLDTGFNSTNGMGFQMIIPGRVGAIAVQPDKKVIIAGRFDIITDVIRYKIARLNADNTIDNSFVINTGTTGNRFSSIREIYTLNLQQDGKIIVTGNFKYIINGFFGGYTRENVVRLNADGSIDSSFHILINFSDDYYSGGGGKNKTATQDNDKVLVAAAHTNNYYSPQSPTRLNSDGSKDLTWNPAFYDNSAAVYAYDVEVQPDQKVLISGIKYINNATVIVGFIFRLNADGSIDQSFQKLEEISSIYAGYKAISEFSLLPDGKILFVKSNGNNYPTPQSTISRLNANGTPDKTFSTGTGANGVIHEMLLLTNGQILIGGKFTEFNGQTRQNLALINADGSLAPTNFNINEEVLSLAIDSEGDILVGCSYLARLTISSPRRHTRFDFDGDGGADLATFAQTSGDWLILRSGTNQPVTTHFGANSDKSAAADFDGDGKTDIAVYRPAEGNWYLLQSTAGFTAIRWGAFDDKPVPADYDGDGKADVAVWRSTNGVWYVLQSSNSQLFAIQFGQHGDIALHDADFDGDARTDIAVWRPSNGTFYWLASASNNQFNAMQFGQNGDIPAVADYNGDGKADFVVFRPSTGTWFQNLTSANGALTFSAVQFGQNGDIPVATDYDGDGKTDIAVRRQENWYLLKSGQGYSGVSFGSANARPVAGLQNQ